MQHAQHVHPCKRRRPCPGYGSSARADGLQDCYRFVHVERLGERGAGDQCVTPGRWHTRTGADGEDALGMRPHKGQANRWRPGLGIGPVAEHYRVL